MDGADHALVFVVFASRDGQHVADAPEVRGVDIGAQLEVEFTPHGIFELKYFFNSALSSSDGGQVGSESVKARIRSLIEGEDSAHPLSDEEISTRLNDGLGVKIARRTVAKYREELGLPSSSRRKKHL